MIEIAKESHCHFRPETAPQGGERFIDQAATVDSSALGQIEKHARPAVERSTRRSRRALLVGNPTEACILSSEKLPDIGLQQVGIAHGIKVARSLRRHESRVAITGGASNDAGAHQTSHEGPVDWRKELPAAFLLVQLLGDPVVGPGGAPHDENMFQSVGPRPLNSLPGFLVGKHPAEPVAFDSLGLGPTTTRQQSEPRQSAFIGRHPEIVALLRRTSAKISCAVLESFLRSASLRPSKAATNLSGVAVERQRERSSNGVMAR